MAVGDTLARWDTRRDWSGEAPAAGAYLLQRFESVEGTGTTRTLADAANPDAPWSVLNYAGSAGLASGRWGNHLTFNRTNPATEQTSLRVPYRAGMWPSSGVLLFGAWAALSFSMAFTPILSTRNTTGKTPLVYLSALGDGRPRAMVYNAAGAAVMDQSEPAASIPWTQTPNVWVWYGWQIDLDARTSQLVMVNRDTGQKYVGPVRAMSGAANAACEAALEVGTLSPTAAYWANGWIDEVGYWQLAAPVNLAALAESVRLSLPARGRDGASALDVGDGGVIATAPATLLTGARPAAWAAEPSVVTTPPIGATPAALLSSDGGATWDAPATLPASFDGLVRWSVPLAAGEAVEALELIEQPPAPALDDGMLEAVQGATVTVALTGSWYGTPTFTAIAPDGVRVTFDATIMIIEAGWAVGSWPITVVVADDTGRTASAVWPLTVTEPDPAPDAPNPVYAESPLILYSALDERAAVLPDPVGAVLTDEVNGEQTVTFVMPEAHRFRDLVRVERIVEVAGELYRIRRLTSYREGGVPLVEVYAEARFYDLGAAGQVTAREFAGVQPGTAIAYALDGTGWTIGRVNVTTARSYALEEGSPLAALRQIAKVHGGDLTFDNTNRTVSLLTFAGRRNGLTFIYGHGATGAKRVEDTTTLVTRIYARNADGLTIADVNGGVPYVEDNTWTTEVRSAVYDFKSGTNPYTMLAMAVAALGKRSRPSLSYEVDVVDLSAWSGQELDRFAVGDEVRVVDTELGVDVVDRIVRLEYDLVRPWASKVTLAEKLRQLGDSDSTDAGVLNTGTDIDTRDMVPFNLLHNARFDNGLAHWAASGATIVPEGVTGPNAVELGGGGVRWIEQTVAPDTRDVYTLSFALSAIGWPDGVTPELLAVAEVTYDDGTTETIEQRVT